MHRSSPSSRAKFAQDRRRLMTKFVLRSRDRSMAVYRCVGVIGGIMCVLRIAMLNVL